MHSPLHLACSILGLATFASAQTYVIAPDNAALTQPSSSTGAWRDSTTGFRSQFIYDTSHFTNIGVTGAIVINRMRFRAANASTTVGGNYPGNGTSTGIVLDIGTSATDYATPSTTFATNRGTMQNVMTWATVTCAAGAGATPNNYVIDITIPGGFVYDPTLGADLLIDITGSDFIGTLPTMSTGVSLAASRCNRVSNTPSTALTGTTSAGFCPVVLFDIAGSGGYPDNGSGFPLLEAPSATAYGEGCRYSRSFGELFPIAAPALDLGTSIQLVPDVAGAPTRYIVQPGSANYRARGTTLLLSNASTPAALTDDTMSQACSLGFTFPFVGGSCTQIMANTDGYISLGTTTVTGGDFDATFADMVGGTGTHAGLPRLFPLWYDLHAQRNTTTNPGAGMYFDVDTVNSKAYVTYENVGEFATSTAGAKLFNFQIELSSDGRIEFRYGTMSTFGSTLRPKLVGFTPGAGSAEPVSHDISALMPWLTDAIDVPGLGLSATPPRIGALCTITTANVPAPGVTLNWISSVQVNPGVDLGFLGITGGCNAYMDISAQFNEALLLGTGSVAFGVPVPLNIALIGVNGYSQSVALNPAFNAFGAQVSNGLTLHVGNTL